MSDVLKILLIEDNETDAFYLNEVLSGVAGFVFNLKNASRLSESIALMEREDFDLVLLDLNLPDSQGMSTAVCARQHTSAPIVVLTGLADEELALKLLHMDIQDYLIKGDISRDQLTRSIRYAIERMRVFQALREREERYRSLFNSIDEGYCVVEMRIEPDQPLDYRFMEVNVAFERQSSLRDVVGKWMRDLRPDLEEFWYEIFRDVAITGNPIRFENSSSSFGGRTFTLYAFRIDGPEKKQVAILFNDITEQKRLESRIKHMAYHDTLTGLPNRRLLQDIVSLRLAETRRNKKKLAVMCLDLDRFKEVNDTFGHKAGDELLQEAAERLRKSVRESDTVARIGGDEFNMILADIVHVEDIIVVAGKIRRSFLKKFHIAGRELKVTASIGISIYPDDSEEIEAVFRNADQAMYHAKEIGRNTFYFSNSILNAYHREIRFENRLAQAIERKELEIFYQPQVNLETGRMIGAEAMVRWNHPEMGLLESGTFIAAAEKTGFIATIDKWVLENVCSLFRQKKSFFLPGKLTVNISARYFYETDFTDHFSSIISNCLLPAGCLEIDIKENVVMSDTDRATARLIELAKLGIGISLDDFGEGCSSLSCLRRLPFKSLKMSRKTIKEIVTDPDSRVIAKAITLMAHNMDLKVSAVGVENDEQLSFLRGINCDDAQGYYFSRALPVPELKTFITAHS